jgi:hypothetical protein
MQNPSTLLKQLSLTKAQLEDVLDPLSDDPLIQGLVDRLPKPDNTWSLEDRVKWLRTAANIFVLIYEAGDGEDREIRFVLAKDETAGKTV